MTRWPSRRLSQIDAFFVAYQERSGILMSLGCNVTMRGRLSRALVEASLDQLLVLWPRLGQRLRKRAFGLAWSGEPDRAAMLHEAADPEALDRWRNRPIDPFREPPFQVLWIAAGERQTLSCRLHHAAGDGESLFLVCREMARFLGDRTSPSARPEPDAPTHFRGFLRSRPLRLAALHRLFDYQRRVASEARSPTTARLPLLSTAPGDTAVLAHTVPRGELDALKGVATSGRVSSAAIVAAAWMRTLRAWMDRKDVESGAATASVALEIPVSLRRAPEAQRWLGNFITPLLVVGDAREETGALAKTIHRQLARDYRHGLHLATPFLTSFGRYLPWTVFRRVAVGTSATGFATSHVTWLRAPGDLEAELREVSRGAIELDGIALWTPVCREMGAALAVLELPASLEVFITHRLRALSPRDARFLAERLAEELRSVSGLERRRLA